MTDIPCGISLQLKTNEPRQVVAARLAASIAPPPSARLKPIRIADWLTSITGKLFVGSLSDYQFKLGLLKPSIDGIRWRGNALVIVGAIEDNAVHALLRPPLFNVLFMVFWTAALSFGFTLSFFEPSNTITVHLLLAAMLVLPLVVFIWMFKYEARLAERALRHVIGVDAA